MLSYNVISNQDTEILPVEKPFLHPWNYANYSQCVILYGNFVNTMALQLKLLKMGFIVEMLRDFPE